MSREYCPHTMEPHPPARRISRGIRGQATLSFILLVSGVIIEVAIAGAFVVYFLSSSNRGARLSERAFTAAQAGLADVQVRLTRDKTVAASGPVSYALAVGSDHAAVEVSRTVADQYTYRYLATSTGMAGTRSRRVVGVFSVEQLTGQVRSGTFGEVSF